MSTNPSPAIQIDFEAIKKNVTQLSPAERAKKLEAFRSRQLLQQKKQAAKGGQAAYNKRRNEEFKLMKMLAMEESATEAGFANMWEQIEAHSKQEADAKFDEFLDAEAEKSDAEVA